MWRCVQSGAFSLHVFWMGLWSGFTRVHELEVRSFFMHARRSPRISGRIKVKCGENHMTSRYERGICRTILVCLSFASANVSSSMNIPNHESRMKVILSDNLTYLKSVPSETVDLIYVDPPFNTGRKQIRKRFHTENNVKVDEDSYGYEDSFDDLVSFLEPRIREAYRILKESGALFFHLDYREVHYCKVMIDKVFGRSSFINEIIWAYDYGARSKNRWSAKHDNILWYVKNPSCYTFNFADMDRIPYMAPELVGPEKAARGKTPTDVWWHTIVSPNSKEKTGYATQKPRGVIDRIVKIHSNKGDLLMDFFAGSGTFGESAYELGRNCILVDNNPAAISVMKRRFADKQVEWVNCDGIVPAKSIPTNFPSTVEGFYQPSTIRPNVKKSDKKRGRPSRRHADNQMELL